MLYRTLTISFHGDEDVLEEEREEETGKMYQQIRGTINRALFMELRRHGRPFSYTLHDD